MKKLYFLFFLLGSISFAQDLELKGVIDFTVPEGGSDGKALHLYVINDIADLSLYGIGVANNGGGTDGQEYTFPVMPASAGDHIFLPRSISAMTNYLESLAQFDIVIEADVASQNGDDAVELFFNGTVIETFGDIDCRPSSDGTTTTCPNYQYYEDAWAYKDVDTWSFADAQCTDGSTTSRTSSCPYPFLDPTLSNKGFLKSEVSIYPNPVNNGLVTIESKLSGEKNIELFDLTGRRIEKQVLKSETLNLQSINPGMYLLRVSIQDKSSTTKLIIK